MASVEHVEHADGSHSVGVTVDGVHVPFVTLSAARVGQLVENGKNTAGDTKPKASSRKAAA